MDDLQETWVSRELPILRAALWRLDAGDDLVDLETLRARFEMPGPQMLAAIDALSHADPPYIEVELRNGWSDWHASGHITRVLERGRRELGTWPSAESLISEIAAALTQASSQVAEPEEQGRLRAVADAFTGFARDVAVDVAAKHLGG